MDNAFVKKTLKKQNLNETKIRWGINIFEYKY